jgi:methyltransferase (TIGR00027 family)
MVAAGRALGAREPDPSMRNPDSLAEKLLGPDELALIQEHAIGRALSNPEVAISYEAMGTAVLMLVRTRFIDEKLQQAIAGGARQYVILGAGFDTRAYRFKDLLHGLKVFEVDSEATQAYKRKRAEAAIGLPPKNLTYVSIDFNRDQLLETLVRAGFDPAVKTFFTWEGVSMYVAEEGVRATLSTIAAAAPGSSLVMDYTTRGAIDFMHRFPEVGSLMKQLNAWGEPWVFGMPDAQEREFFQSFGLEPRETFPTFSKVAVDRYLTRADGTLYGPPAGAAPRPQLSPEAQQAAVALTQKGSAFYSLAELLVPERA